METLFKILITKTYQACNYKMFHQQTLGQGKERNIYEHGSVFHVSRWRRACNLLLIVEPFQPEQSGLSKRCATSATLCCLPSIPGDLWSDYISRKSTRLVLVRGAGAQGLDSQRGERSRPAWGRSLMFPKQHQIIQSVKPSVVCPSVCSYEDLCCRPLSCPTQWILF